MILMGSSSMTQKKSFRLPTTPSLLFITISVVLLFSACSKERFETTTTLKKFQKDVARKELPANLDKQIVVGEQLSLDETDTTDYLLGPGDLLHIKVLEAEELNSRVRVSSKGYINVPLIGSLKVINKTTTEVERNIEERYTVAYLHDPHVSVYIEEHLSKQITLVGAINTPGTYDYISQKRLLDVLALGGGLKEDAGSFAFLTRRNPKTGKAVDYRIDIDDLVKNGNMALNYVIKGGDIVFIPESGKCFIDGAIRNPGIYTLSNNMTITEAIAQAGGLAGYADDDSIKLIRFMGRGQKREIISLSYGDLQAGVGDTLLLKDQDIIYAESSTAGKIFSGSGLTIGFMGTGVSFRDPEK